MADEQNKTNEDVNVNQQNNNQTDQTEKKMGFFKKVWYSITKFEKYPEMAVEGVPRAFLYLLELTLIFSIIVSLGFIFQFHTVVKKGVNYMQNELPDMSYSDGTLKVDSNEAIKINTDYASISKVIIDTNTDDEKQIDSYKAEIPSDSSGIIILKDKMVVRNGAADTSIDYSYKDILNNFIKTDKSNITKQDMVNYLTGSGIANIYAMVFMTLTVFVWIAYFINVVISYTIMLSLLGLITAMFAKLRLKFSAIYNMTIYSLTLSIILEAIYMVVNTLTGFEIKYFEIMYVSVAYIYLITAIFIIRADFIKKQGELMKIIEEQNRVKEELKQQKHEEEQKNEKPENDENKKEDKKENKTEKKEDSEKEGKTNGDEPSELDGSGA